MKIYTKKGDKGNTILSNNVKISKSDKLIEFYGTIDELIANIGLIYSEKTKKEYFNICRIIQSKLMNCITSLVESNNLKDSNIEHKLKIIKEKDIKYLEEQIDLLDKDLEPLKDFILFEGKISSIFNVLRTITRRAERKIVEIYNNISYKNNENILIIMKYLNRLSDLFFILSRHSNE
jgi:cob(I)alamin adenosyltransferase